VHWLEGMCIHPHLSLKPRSNGYGFNP